MRIVALLCALVPLSLLLLGFVLPRAEAIHPPFSPPGRGNLLGTDDVGQDIFSQLASGGLTTIGVGAAAGVLATLLGLLVGGAAGYWPRLETGLTRFTDLILTFPRLPLLVLLSLYLKPNPLNAVVVLALFGWPSSARTVRPAVSGLREAGHVQIAKSMNASGLYIIFRHILPQLTPLILVQLLLEIRFGMVAQTGLAFLGLTDPSVPSWGLMLFQAFRHPQTFLGPYWLWTVLPPALALALAVLALSLSLLTDERQLDPRLRRETT